MLNKINKVAIVCGDLEASAKFYTETLDLEIVERLSSEYGNYIFLKGGAIIVELMEKSKFTPDEGVHNLSFVVDDIDASIRDLQSKGIVLVGDKLKPGKTGITIQHFKGPDNLLFQLYQRD